MLTALSRSPGGKAAHYLGRIDLSGTANVQTGKTLSGSIDLSGSLSLQQLFSGQIDLFGTTGYFIRYPGFADDLIGTVAISSSPTPAGWGPGHIELTGTMTFSRSLQGMIDSLIGTVNFTSFAPNSLSVPTLDTPIQSDDPVGTLIAEVQQEGGIGAAYDGIWSITGGSTKARIRSPGTGKKVAIEVKTVYDTDTGPSHVNVQVTGGELGSTILSKRIDYEVDAATAPTGLITWRSGLSTGGSSNSGTSLSTAAHAAVFGTWRGRPVRAIQINSSIANSTWAEIAATSDSLATWGTKITDMAAADMYPILNLPVAAGRTSGRTGDTFAAVAGATAGVNNTLYKKIKAVADAFMAALAGNAGAARFGWEPTTGGPFKAWRYNYSASWAGANTSGTPTNFTDVQDAFANLITIFNKAAADAGNTKFKIHWCQHYGWRHGLDAVGANKYRSLEQGWPGYFANLIPTIDIYDAYQGAIKAASADRTLAGYTYTATSFSDFSDFMETLRLFADGKTLPWGIDEHGLMDYQRKDNSAGNDNLLWPQAMYDYCTGLAADKRPHHDCWFHAIDTLPATYNGDSAIHAIVQFNSGKSAIVENGPWSGPSAYVRSTFSSSYVGSASADATGEAAARYKSLWKVPTP